MCFFVIARSETTKQSPAGSGFVVSSAERFVTHEFVRVIVL